MTFKKIDTTTPKTKTSDSFHDRTQVNPPPTIPKPKSPPPSQQQKSNNINTSTKKEGK
jgi:hypothetical protein